MGRRNVPGTIYLIHFDRPYRHARHYLGWTEGPVEERVARHRSGGGSPLIRAVQEAGIGWRVVVTWDGDRHFERGLKKRKNIKRLCPVCQAGHVGLATEDGENDGRKPAGTDGCCDDAGVGGGRGTSPPWGGGQVGHERGTCTAQGQEEDGRQVPQEEQAVA